MLYFDWNKLSTNKKLKIMKFENNEYFIYYEMALDSYEMYEMALDSPELALEIVFEKSTQFAHPAPSLSNCVANQR